MCLILFAYRSHPRYRLVVAANRDEFYARATAPLAYWKDSPELLAGRDLEAGGAWMGMTRSGRFAAVTNFRDPTRLRPGAPSRGELVSGYLQAELSPRHWLETLAPGARAYNGFNLLAGDRDNLWYFSNHDGPPRAVNPGVHGLSNHLLDSPWPKVEQGRRRLAEIITRDTEPDLEALFRILEDRHIPPDTSLPATGVGLAKERMLAPAFIESASYGTRSSSLLLIDDRSAVFLEKQQPNGPVQEVTMRLQQEALAWV